MNAAEERFGPYTVYECIGTGGMATVHRATLDRGDGVVRDVALKRLLPQHVDDKTFVDDFLREGQIASRLHHPGIVSIVDIGKIGSTQFIAMELVRGQSMMQLIRKAHVAKQPAPIGIVIALISELCDALDYACNGNDSLGERLNIIHRDLSPSNLIIADDGHLRVIDFGVAKAISGRFATTTGLVKGKLGYMSIEALAGKALDGRADVFSTGVVAWELLTGRRLFTGANEMEIVQRVRSGAVTPPSAINPACPPSLDGVVQKALARSRDDRWPTAAAFRDALEQIRRAYREESSVAEVKRWRDAICNDAPPRATRPIIAPPQAIIAAPAAPPPQLPVLPQASPPPAPPPLDLREPDDVDLDNDEVTVHRAMPLRVPPRPTERTPPITMTSAQQPPPRRAMTEMELLDLEPPEAQDPGATAFEARAYEPPPESPDLPDEPDPASAFDLGGEPSRTYTGQIGASAFGGPTAQTAPVPRETVSGATGNPWPESATMLNLDAYQQPAYREPPPAYPEDGPSSYAEIVMQDEEPSLLLEPPPETRPAMTSPQLTVPHISQAELDEVLDLDAPPPGREEMLDLEAPPPPREEFLDLEEMTNAGFDAPTLAPPSRQTRVQPPPQAPPAHAQQRGQDTVIVPSLQTPGSSPRRKRP